MPTGLVNLGTLDLSGNLLTNLTLPNDLEQLTELNLYGNKLRTLQLPGGLDKLSILNLDANPFYGIGLPAGYPLLYQTVVNFQNNGVGVTLFPISKSPRLVDGHFTFDAYGNSGTVVIQRSTDWRTWQDVGSVVIPWPNYPGVTFSDTNGPPPDKAIYRLKVPLK
jgi:hypothetical protein